MSEEKRWVIDVRFPEKEDDVQISISIIQNGFPMKESKVSIHVQPECKEVTKIDWQN